MNSANATSIVFIGAFALVLGVIIVVQIANYHNLRLKSEERMAAIAKGIALPPENDLASLMATASEASALRGADRARGVRTGGLVLVSIGAGLGLLGFCLYWILQERDVLAVSAAGLVPLAIGVGLIVDYVLRNRPPQRELTASLQSERARD